MELPKTNFFPPFNITRASHLVLTARDLATSRDFYTEVIGLIVTDETPDTLWLRGIEERCHHSLTIKRTNGQQADVGLPFRLTRENLKRRWIKLRRGDGLNEQARRSQYLGCRRIQGATNGVALGGTDPDCECIGIISSGQNDDSGVRSRILNHAAD